MENILNICKESLQEHQFIGGIWSNPRLKQGQFEKITAKAMMIKDIPTIQFTTYKDNKAYHTNCSFDQTVQYIQDNCSNFKQCQLFTGTKDYHALINKKGKAVIKQFAPTKEVEYTSHNRKKNYIIDSESSEVFLKQLGIMTEDGKIKPSKYDKYKQINKYLETIQTVSDSLDQEFIRIIDFGCGKSYLTFAMYHYLTEMLGKNVEIVGLDLKEDVIAFCNDLASELGYNQLKFQVGDIGCYTTNKKIDMVVSLHACNTATDAALYKAINWKAKVILAVPCCHNECYTQIKEDTLSPILKHGILKEKVASFVTDGLRAQLLEAAGYKVNVAEFIDMQHTPKNILIRAIDTGKGFDKSAYRTYVRTSDFLHLNLTLDQLLGYSHHLEK